ncbi:nucleoid-associated protein [Fulvivirga lutimaris]|uniref:nucleoid-associated protein n=1 Tax=Fulvivirga lutimaris TaxID=1819566 RepID=UPI001625F2E7|nr:nucleoid-associated protein [Fulvivirga lutimaris]
MIISDSKINSIITHQVGNKLRDEGYTLSEEASDINEESEEYYLKYFLEVLKTDEKYRFSHPTDIELNEVLNITQKVFDDSAAFLEASQDIAKLLYSHSEHPKINEGALNVVSFSDVAYSGMKCKALGIFKSETNVPFLKIEKNFKNYSLTHDTGYELNGLDKGALIIRVTFNEYEVIVFDKNGSRSDSKFWIDDFLQLELISNEFYQTTELMKVTKEFIKTTVSEEFEISKPDQIDLLNRSMDYLKNTETYDKNEFLDTVLHDEGLKQSYKTFTDDHLSVMNVPESFTISEVAVKKMQRSFKSVLKLDKNFHVYIHGDRDKIEKGVDENGRKYYKIYFEKED